ncbi:MAG: ATP-binding protein, partial [Pseudomonadota bacterium]
QAFLQRVVNGGGRITREYGLGRRRTDLYLEWPVDRVAGWQGEIQRIVLELKLRHASLKTDVTRGLQQTAAYADQCGATEAHLLMFDRRPDIAWQDRIWHQEHAEGNRQITVWGL